VEAVQAWLEAAVITEGPVFRRITTRRLDGCSKPATEIVGSDAMCTHAMAHVVKRACRRARLACGRRAAGLDGHDVTECTGGVRVLITADLAA
jgi:hypothetical protein